MTSALSFLFLLLTFPAQDAQQKNFVGTWVGLQSWAIENPSPSAEQPQPVELTIELVDGKLVGHMLPFFGGSDAAKFNEAGIVGDELWATGVIGPPAEARDRRNSWQENITVVFKLKRDGVRVTGTADVLMGKVNWLKYSYDLSMKRSRY